MDERHSPSLAPNDWLFDFQSRANLSTVLFSDQQCETWHKRTVYRQQSQLLRSFVSTLKHICFDRYLSRRRVSGLHCERGWRTSDCLCSLFHGEEVVRRNSGLSMRSSNRCSVYWQPTKAPTREECRKHILRFLMTSQQSLLLLSSTPNCVMYQHTKFLSSNPPLLLCQPL